MINSSKRRPSTTLAVKLTEKGDELLLDFANCLAESKAFNKFQDKWGERTGLPWTGDEPDFFEEQMKVRRIWEGKELNNESQLVKEALGLQEGRLNLPSTAGFAVEWEAGALHLVMRDLNDGVWLALLQNSRRLAICQNTEGGCPTPYFLRRRRGQRFCCDACALPSQQAFKREWWRREGEKWRRRTRRAKKST
jgi:hypothetical protein